MSALLSVKGLTAGYGGVPIIENINIDVAEHEIAVIIGPNGAGKSTLLKTIFALTARSGGEISFAGKDISELRTAKLVPLGISMVPQSHNVFPTLNVNENLEPKLLLLDEPTAGLSPAYLEIIFDLLLDIRKRGVTILMVEQNAKQALRIADNGHVLVSGKNFKSGTGEALLNDDVVRRSFLGGASA